MPVPRRLLVDDARPGTYHVISRCVRRAFLCGDAAEHRRTWVRELIQQASASFAVEVLAYAVMSNHLHIVVRTDPARTLTWTDADVAARWSSAHPRLDADGSWVAWNDTAVSARARDSAWVAQARRRLGSLSWFMKCVKERLSRRANRADGCTGAFWEGRFRSVPLLDQAAVIAAMAYVDLNPIRARLADRPETSAFTSVQERCRARQAARAAQAVPTLLPERGAEDGLWVAPMAAATIDIPEGCAFTPAITLDAYLELVDATGRVVVAGKRGAIPPELAPILERLDLDVATWLRLMGSGGGFGRGAVGALTSRAREALRRGARWLMDLTAGLYRTPHTA
jgi:hypothetical protein